MSKLFLVSVFISVFAVSLAKVMVSTNLSLVENESTALRFNRRPSPIQIIALSELDKDDGVNNWGDLVHLSRQQGDVLLERDLWIRPEISSEDQTMRFRISLKNVQSISTVRFINVGRQRARATKIGVYANQVEIFFDIPAEADPRVFIEVYGFPSE